MNNYEEIFIRYIDEQLSVDERREFEKSLKSDDKLRADFESYEKVRDLFTDDISSALQNDYFNGVMPEFRKRLGNGDNPVFYQRESPFSLLNGTKQLQSPFQDLQI